MDIIELTSNPFFEKYAEKKFPKQRVIAYMNEIPRFGYLILSGTVRIYSIDGHGFERTISYIGEGDVLPGDYLLGLSKTVLYFYEPVTELVCKEIPVNSFREELETNSKLALGLLRTISLSYFGALVQIESLVQHRAQDKILKLFRYLVLRFGEEQQDGWISISVRLTQGDLADMLGITRETVAVELGKMKKQGIVDYGSFNYRVNISALGDLVESSLWESFRESGFQKP